MAEPTIFLASQKVVDPFRLDMLAPVNYSGCRTPRETSLFSSFNSLRLRRNCRHFADDIFKGILLNETVLMLINISLKFAPKCWINNIPALVQIMAWRRQGNKPLSEPMMVRLLMHICVTRPQWVNLNWNICIQQNAFEDVICGMADILSQPQCVNHAKNGQTSQSPDGCTTFKNQIFAIFQQHQ